MVFVFLFLTYFTLCDRLSVHPHFYKWPNFIIFYGWVILHWIHVSHLYPFIWSLIMMGLATFLHSIATVFIFVNMNHLMGRYFEPMQLSCPSGNIHPLVCWFSNPPFLLTHCSASYCCCSVTKSCPTLWPHGLQQARLPCPSLSPWVCSN